MRTPRGTGGRGAFPEERVGIARAGALLRTRNHRDLLVPTPFREQKTFLCSGQLKVGYLTLPSSEPAASYVIEETFQAGSLPHVDRRFRRREAC